MQQDAPSPVHTSPEASFGLSTRRWGPCKRSASIHTNCYVHHGRLWLERQSSLQEPSKLHIISAGISAAGQHTDMALSFMHALLPHVAIAASTVYALTAGGFLHSILLPDGATGQQSEVSSALTYLNTGERAAVRLADIAVVTDFPGAARILIVWIGETQGTSAAPLGILQHTLQSISPPAFVSRMPGVDSKCRSSLAGCRISAAGGTYCTAAGGQAHLHRHSERHCAGHAPGLSRARQHRLCCGPEAHCRNGAPPDQLRCQVLPLHLLVDPRP